MNRTRNAIIVVAALAVIVVLAVVFGKHGSNAVRVQTARIKYGDFTVKLPENGVVMNPTTVAIPTLVAGNIQRIYVKAGTRVEAGELLATIENPTLDYNASSSQADYNNAVANVTTARIDEQNAKVQYQAQVDTTKSELDEARRVYVADAALLAQKAIARSQVDADKAKLDQAQVAYYQAVQQLRLGAVSGYGQDSVQAAQAAAEKTKIINAQNQQQVAFTRIVAPASGIIQTVASQSSDALRSLEEGDAVTAGQTLFTMAADNSYVVKAQVDEQDIINVRVGQAARITGQDFPGKTILGHVERIDPVAVKSTDASSTAKQVLTTIAIDSSPPFLKDGMSADIDILTTDVPHGLIVDNSAVNKDAKGSYVYLVTGGIAKKRYIRVAQTGDTQSLVASGLHAGDVVVDQSASSAPELKDGARVSALPSSSPSPAST